MTKEQKDTANWLLQQICVSHIQAIEIPDENFVNKMLSCSVFMCFHGLEFHKSMKTLSREIIIL